MWRRRVLGVLALGLLSVSPTSCGGKRKEAMTERSFRLPNGLQVDLVAGPCGDEVGLAVLFEVGIDHDPAGRSGMALLVGRLLAPPGPAGAERMVEIGNDHSMYSVVVGRDQLFGELDDLAARMGRTEIREEDLAGARAHVLGELAKMRGGDPARTAMSYAAEAIQPARGNGWRGGIAAEVEAIDVAQLAAFWQAHVKPGNARVIVVGRFDADKIQTRIETAFAGLPAGTPPALRDPVDATVTGTLVIGDKPSAAAVAVAAPKPADPAYAAFLVLAARLMGGAPGSAWQASYDPLARPETLFVSGAVQSGEQPDAAAARIRGAIATVIAQPLAPGDVAAARSRFSLFLGAEPLSPASCKKDPRGLAIARVRRAQLHLDGAALAKSLDATTQEQLAEAAKLFAAQRTAAVIAGGTIR